MAVDPTGGARPPVVLRIKLRYEDVEAMVQRFAPNVGKSGLFLPTKSLQPVGAEVKFELRLANDTPVLLGLGRVKVTKEPDPANPKASFGMAIELMRVTRESRDLILRMLERRKQLGLPEVAIPLPSDLDAARRSDLVDTGVKNAIPARDSSPVVESAPIVAARPEVASGPVAVARTEPLPSDVTSAPVPSATRDSQPESLLTAPRRASGPLAIAKVAAGIDPLPPEPPRKKRPAISDLIEAASGPIAAVHVPGLDDHVDVGAVLARARLLATGDLDAELDALREASAAPLAEIGIEVASAELARQLGGAAVRRDSRGHPAGWAPPPAVVDEKRPDKPAEAEAAPIEGPAETPIEAAVEAPAVEAPAVEAAAAKPTFASAPTAPEPAETYADPGVATAALDDRHELDDHDELQTPVSPQEAITEIGEPEQAEHEVEPEQIHDEIHQLGESDYEEVEHTHVGGDVTLPPTFEEHAYLTTPAVEQQAMAERLDQHLADVEAESEHDDLGIGEASGHYLRSKIGLPPAEIYDGDDPLPDAPVLDELPQGVEADQPAIQPTLPPEYAQDFIHRFDTPESRDPDRSPSYAEPAYEEPYREDPPEFREEANTEHPDLSEYREQNVEPQYVEPQYVEQQYDAAPETVDAYGQTIDAEVIGRPAEPGENLDDIEEIDDFEILAEADEEDADLLSSSGEADVSGSRELRLAPPSDSDFAMPGRPSHSDFAMRLDLGDEEPEQGAFVPQDSFIPQDVFTPDPFTQQPYVEPEAVPEHSEGLARSAGHALAGFENEEDESSASYTFAEMPQHHAPEHLPPDEFDDPHSSFSAPDKFDQSDVIVLNPTAHEARTRPRHDSRAGMPESPMITPTANEPYILRGPPPQAQWDENSDRNQWQSPPAAEESDLESALQALDVDLDDLSMPAHASTELARDSHPKRATIRPPSEAQIPNTEKPARKSTRIPKGAAGRAPRSTTEDGVLIDFDEDE